MVLERKGGGRFYSCDDFEVNAEKQHQIAVHCPAMIWAALPLHLSGLAGDQEKGKRGKKTLQLCTHNTSFLPSLFSGKPEKEGGKERVTIV